MAQDAELKLKVSLDLSYFKAQLSRLPIEAAGYSAPINVKINQKSIADQYRLLNKYFGKKEFRIEVNSNLEAEIKNAGRLVKALQSVQKVGVKTTGGLPLGVGQLGIKKPTGGLGVEEIRKLFNASIQAGLLDPKTLGKTREQMVTALGSIGRDSIEGLLNGLDSGNAKIRSAAELLGKDLIAVTKNVLGIASPSKIFDALGRFTAEGFDDGFTKRFKKFKGDAIAEIGQFIARVKIELAKVGDFISGNKETPAEKLFRQSTAYNAPIGPLPLGSGAPWARGSRGMYGSSGFEPRMESRAFGQAYPAPPGSFLAFSRAASQIGRGGAPSSFLEFSQRASLVKQGGGGGFVPPGGFPTEGILGGKVGPATFIGAGSSMEKFKTAIDIASASMRNFRASSLPLIGGIKEIGGEFLNATKQVLLYGTAYKGLAFVTSLPGQILNAAKSQQQFNNALQTATQDTGTFAKELLYVDNVQRAFGLNLETTRTGFTKLYASMAPTGFDSGSIEKLFTGISAATAALQLTPDKAERVIYAFGQMASKGQIMSEELKGQLGDVLPGALAIFAKAAGMSVKEFSQAMEDGVFVGGKFREVFAKVSDELMNRFGTGAQAAGKSLQGLLNTVQGDFQRTLESFAPLANVAAQAILGPLSGALKQLSMAAQIAMGEQERAQKQLQSAQQDAKDLQIGGAKPEQILAAQQNVAALQAKVESLNLAAKDPAIAEQAKNLQSFVSEVGKAGTAVVNIARAIGSVLNPVMTFLGTNLSGVITALASFAIGLAAVRVAATVSMTVLTLLNVLIKQVSSGAVGVNALSAAFRGLGVSATTAQIGVIGLGNAFKVLLFSSGIGIAVGLFTAIATAALGMGDAMSQAAGKAKQAMQNMAQAAIAGNTALLNMQVATSKAELATLNALEDRILKRGKKAFSKTGAQQIVKSTAAERLALGELGAQVSPGMSPEDIRRTVNDARYILENKYQRAVELQPLAQQNAARMGLNQPTPAAAAPEAPSEKATQAASKLADEMMRQAMAASDSLFKEQQRFDILKQTNPIAKIFAEYASEELTIQRDLNKALKESKSEKEKNSLKETASIQSANNLLTLQEKIKQVRQDALKPIQDLLANQEQQRQMDADIEQLIKNGINPERAKQVAEVRKLVRAQLEALDGQINNARAALNERESREGSTKAVQALRKELQGLEEDRKKAETDGKKAEEGVPEEKAKSQGQLIQEGYDKVKGELEKLISLSTLVMESAKGISEAFGNSFKEIVNGSMTAQEALASFFQNIGDYFLDMAARMIAKWMEMQAIGLAQSLLSGLGGFFTGNASIAGSAAQYTGGEFAGGSFGVDTSGMTGPLKPFANGGIAKGGFVPFRAFAEGGMVAGPTLGLVGEGKYNEAIIPMPNGKSVPVDLQGAAPGNQIVSNITVNVSNGKAETQGGAGGGADLSRKLEGAVKQVIIGELRPGGVLAGKR